MAVVSLIMSARGNELTREGRNCLAYLLLSPAKRITDIFPSGPMISLSASNNAENTTCFTFSGFFLVLFATRRSLRVVLLYYYSGLYKNPFACGADGKEAGTGRAFPRPRRSSMNVGKMGTTDPLNSKKDEKSHQRTKKKGGLTRERRGFRFLAEVQFTFLVQEEEDDDSAHPRDNHDDDDRE